MSNQSARYNGYNIGVAYSDGSVPGRTIRLIATGSFSMYDANNLKLASTWNATADSTITLLCDGTNWYEISRSSN